ncbi:MAG: hypothetical protein QOF38_3454 [Pseudonocardiales bacterium]|nr:hypothetical protein [Pseudonocardiales bacterium]
MGHPRVRHHPVRQHKSRHGVVIRADKPSYRHQPRLVTDPRRPRVPGHLTGNEAQNLSPSGVDAEDRSAFGGLAPA